MIFKFPLLLAFALATTNDLLSAVDSTDSDLTAYRSYSQQSADIGISDSASVSTLDFSYDLGEYYVSAMKNGQSEKLIEFGKSLKEIDQDVLIKGIVMAGLYNHEDVVFIMQLQLQSLNFVNDLVRYDLTKYCDVVLNLLSKNASGVNQAVDEWEKYRDSEFIESVYGYVILPLSEFLGLKFEFPFKKAETNLIDEEVGFEIKTELERKIFWAINSNDVATLSASLKEMLYSKFFRNMKQLVFAKGNAGVIQTVIRSGRISLLALPDLLPFAVVKDNLVALELYSNSLNGELLKKLIKVAFDNDAWKCFSFLVKQVGHNNVNDIIPTFNEELQLKVDLCVTKGDLYCVVFLSKTHGIPNLASMFKLAILKGKYSVFKYFVKQYSNYLFTEYNYENVKNAAIGGDVKIWKEIRQMCGVFSVTLDEVIFALSYEHPALLNEMLRPTRHHDFTSLNVVNSMLPEWSVKKSSEKSSEAYKILVEWLVQCHKARVPLSTPNLVMIDFILAKSVPLVRFYITYLKEENRAQNTDNLLDPVVMKVSLMTGSSAYIIQDLFGSGILLAFNFPLNSTEINRILLNYAGNPYRTVIYEYLLQFIIQNSPPLPFTSSDPAEMLTGYAISSGIGTLINYVVLTKRVHSHLYSDKILWMVLSKGDFINLKFYISYGIFDLVSFANNAIQKKIAGELNAINVSFLNSLFFHLSQNPNFDSDERLLFMKASKYMLS